jgi:hypothetical protein
MKALRSNPSPTKKEKREGGREERRKEGREGGREERREGGRKEGRTPYTLHNNLLKMGHKHKFKIQMYKTPRR